MRSGEPAPSVPGASSGSVSAHAPAPRRRGWLARRWRAMRAPALLYAVLAAVMLAPFAPRTFRNAGDLYGVVGAIVEVRNALLEGQFPVRVPPNAQDGVRYPIFQFYGNTPLMLPGLLYTLLPVDPYVAWKLATWGMLTTGALFTCALARRLTRRRPASVLAGALFMTSPYMFADVVARGAYTEFFAFNLLPVVLYFAWRAYASRKLWIICAGAIAWALLGTSHNITYLYAVVFFGLFFLLLFAIQFAAGRGDRPARAKAVGRLARVSAAGALHLPMVMWYLAPQLAVVKDLVIASRLSTPQGWAHLSALGTLFQPIAQTPAGSSTSGLTLQIGPIVLLGVALALLAGLRPGTPRRHRSAIAAMALLFALAVFMVWSPFDFWARLPAQFSYVQFPYRIMMFVATFGCLLTAYGAGLVTLRRGPGFRRWFVYLLLVAAGAVGSTYLPRGGSFSPGLVERQVRDPLMTGLEDYHVLMSRLARTSAYHPDLNFAGPEWGLAGREFLRDERYLVRRAPEVAIPTPQAAVTSFRVEGSLPPGERGDAYVVIQLGDVGHKEPVQPGPFAFSVPLAAPPDGKPVRLHAYAVAQQDGEHIDVRLTRLQFEPRAQGAFPDLVQADALRPKVRYGRRSKITLQLERPSLVQLPVLYYPGLLSVNVDRKPVAYGNLGRFVALELGAGEHKIDVAFTGLAWANYASAIGWLLVLATLLVLSVRHRVRTAAERRRERLAARAAAAASRPAGPNRFTPLDALAACAAVVLGGLAAEAAFRAARYQQARENAVGFAADRPDADGNLALAHAFDDLPTTAWAVGGSRPVTLTLTPPKPDVLQGIDLHARETSLYETWRTVRVVCSLDGATVFEQSYTFDDAHLTTVQTIELTAPTQTDRVQLYFSDPVVLTRAKQRVSESAVNPGYREIKLTWVRP